jgi:hypothetical protein
MKPEWRAHYRNNENVIQNAHSVGLSFPKTCLELKHPNHQHKTTIQHRSYRNLKEFRIQQLKTIYLHGNLIGLDG